MTRFVRNDPRGAIRIGPRLVGPGLPAYIIAEAGVNHDGSLETAFQLVEAAVAAGADAVKFQIFRAQELTTAAAPAVEYQRRCGPATQRELLARLELTTAEFARLRAHCADRGIEFLATPFSPADVERVVRLDVAALKLASTDLTNRPLLAAAARTGLPLIVSTGASTAEEIAESVRWLRQWRAAERTVLLHCVSSYPTPLEAANLRAIATKSARFELVGGFSDHTTDPRVGAWAVALGACLLEKHLTLDPALPGPDHAISLTPSQMQAYIAAVRDVETALGSGQIGVHPLEVEVRRNARQSLVLSQPLPAGATLAQEWLTIKRPGGGIRPQELPAVIGRRLKQPVAADTVLTWDMLG